MARRKSNKQIKDSISSICEMKMNNADNTRKWNFKWVSGRLFFKTSTSGNLFEGPVGMGVKAYTHTAYHSKTPRRVMMKKLILALLISIPAHADVYLGGWSNHLESGDFNETHNLIAVESNQVVAGYFKNSYSKDTYFLGYNANVIDNEYVNAGLIFGAMRGYDDNQVPISIDGIAPFASPYISFGDWYVKPTVLILGSAVALTFRVDI